MAEPFETPERPFGAVKKTEEELQAVPIPREQPDTSVNLAAIQAQGQQAISENSYQRDILAESPLATLPMDVQNNLTMAKNWYEIAVHPASTEFERALAMAHLEDLDTQPQEEEENGESTRQPDREA